MSHTTLSDFKILPAALSVIYKYKFIQSFHTHSEKLCPSMTSKPPNCGSAKDIPFKCSRTEPGHKYQMNLNNSSTSFHGSERKKNPYILFYSLDLISTKFLNIHKKIYINNDITV